MTKSPSYFTIFSFNRRLKTTELPAWVRRYSWNNGQWPLSNDQRFATTMMVDSSLFSKLTCFWSRHARLVHETTVTIRLWVAMILIWFSMIYLDQWLFIFKKNCIFAFLICTSRNAAQGICCRHIQLGMSWVGAFLYALWFLHVVLGPSVRNSIDHRSCMSSRWRRFWARPFLAPWRICASGLHSNEEWAVVQTLVQIDYSDINKTTK